MQSFEERALKDLARAGMDSPMLQARSGSVLRDRTNTISTPKLAHDEKASPQVEGEALPQAESEAHPERGRLESELYENRALLHRVLREKQQFLSRHRTQGSALEQALVGQEVLIAELQELDTASPSGEAGAGAGAGAEARTQPEIERRFEELHLRLQFKEAALQQQHLETRYFEQQARTVQACTSLHTPSHTTPPDVCARLAAPRHDDMPCRTLAGRTSSSTARFAASGGTD